MLGENFTVKPHQIISMVNISSIGAYTYEYECTVRHILVGKLLQVSRKSQNL